MLSLIAMPAVVLIAMLLVRSRRRNIGQIKGYVVPLLKSRVATVRTAIAGAVNELRAIDRQRSKVTARLLSLEAELCDLLDALRCPSDPAGVIWDAFASKSTEDRDWDDPEEVAIQKVPVKTEFIWDAFSAETSADDDWDTKN
jgi:hypothetical protein